MDNPTLTPATRRRPFAAPKEPYVLATLSLKAAIFGYYVVVLAACFWTIAATMLDAEATTPNAACPCKVKDEPAPDAAKPPPAAHARGPRDGGTTVGLAAGADAGKAGLTGANGRSGGPGEAVATAAGLGSGGSNGAASSSEAAVRKPESDRARYDDSELLLLVAMFGAIGGILHGLSSAAVHAGRGRVYANWWLFYFSRPLVGMGTAVLVFLVVRGGLGGLSIKDDRQGEFAALGWAALSGLFSAVAMQKLRDVFEALFRPGANGASPKPPPAPAEAPGGPKPPGAPVQPPTGGVAPPAKPPATQTSEVPPKP